MKIETMLISIIITVRNEERNLPNLLDSLVAQEQPIEIIIIDSASEDRTRSSGTLPWFHHVCIFL